MSIERVVRNSLGFVKQTPIPEGGEQLSIKPRSGGIPAFDSLGKEIFVIIQVSGDSVEVKYHHILHVRRRIVNVNNVLPEVLSKGKEIKGKDESGAVVVYRHVSERMNLPQKIARALHR